jgi:3-deoxy-manno-octulosonate cytidylyltransferase (CMP-KDO synthetase)
MIVGIIPARYASTRLVGKPLVNIGGKPMIQHTYESVKKSKLLSDVIIAVDDEKLFDVVRGFGANAFLTSKDLSTSLERVISIAEKMTADVFLNIPGSHPFISSKMIDQVIEPHLFAPEITITTLAKRIDSVDEMKSATIPKVVFDYNNYALYFSYAPIPFVKEARTNLEKVLTAEMFKHIEVYAYSKEIIESIGKLRPTDLARIEKLEQLRLLEHGYKVKVVVTEEESLHICTPRDLEAARKYYENRIK